MLIWFLALTPILVAEVFRSPMIDYRLVMVGAVLPLGELLLGGPNVLHTLVGSVGLLTLVMVGTQGRRLLRRRILGVPIGMMVHLVLDGSWTNKELFWWPAFGAEFGSGTLPEFDRPLAVTVLMELVGLAAAVWGWRRYELADPENLARFRSTGQLSREVLT